VGSGMAAAEHLVAIDGYLLLSWPTAANLQQQSAAGEWDRQTDGHSTIL